MFFSEHSVVFISVQSERMLAAVTATVTFNQ